MPGQPIKRKMIADLYSAAVLNGLHEDDNGQPYTHEQAALNYIVYWIAGNPVRGSNNTLLGLCRCFSISYSLISQWLRAESARHEVYTRAREAGASYLVDESVEIIDSASPLETHKANARANIRKWLAERWNRTEYGQAREGAASISIAELHLHAHTSRRAALPSDQDRADTVVIPKSEIELSIEAATG